MKKILLMLTMVLVLGFSAICSASNGKVLDAEEAMVNKFLAASNYSAVTSMMTDGMKKDFTEEVFKNFKEQMNRLRTLPCHLPRQIVTVSCSTYIILINGWYGTTKQEAALELRKQIESGIETYGTFSLKSSLAKRITISIMYSVIRMQNALNMNAATTGREITAVVSIHHNRCKVIQKMV